jgi:acyl dehydratase
MPRLWAQTAIFESIKVGDQLPILVKWETRETIERFIALASTPFPDSTNQTSRPAAEEAEPEVVADVAAPPAALMTYVVELLEKAFPLTSIMALGSRLELEPLSPLRPEDTISLSGEVTGKREEEDRRLVECEIIVENQNGHTVARAVAIVAW